MNRGGQENMRQFHEIKGECGMCLIVGGMMVAATKEGEIYTARIPGRYFTSPRLFNGGGISLECLDKLERDRQFLRNVELLLRAYIPDQIHSCTVEYRIGSRRLGKDFLAMLYMYVFTREFVLRIGAVDKKEMHLALVDFTSPRTLMTAVPVEHEVERKMDRALYEIFEKFKGDGPQLTSPVEVPLDPELPLTVVMFCVFFNAERTLQHRDEAGDTWLVFITFGGLITIRVHEGCIYRESGEKLAEPDVDEGALFAIVEKLVSELSWRTLLRPAKRAEWMLVKLPRFASADSIYTVAANFKIFSIPMLLRFRYHSTERAPLLVHSDQDISLWVDATRENMYAKMQDDDEEISISETKRILALCEALASELYPETDRTPPLRNISRR